MRAARSRPRPRTTVTGHPSSSRPISAEQSTPILLSRPPPVDVFVSYAQQDEAFRNELAAHLALLRRLGVIQERHDRRIGKGPDWKSTVDEHLETAHVILLL